MARRFRAVACIALAVAVVTVTVLFLNIFQTPRYELGFPIFERGEILGLDGVSRPFDPDPALFPWDVAEGEGVRLSCRLPDPEELPALYEDGFILFDPSGMDLVLFVDEEEVFRSTDPYFGYGLSFPVVYVPIQPEWAGREFSVLFHKAGSGDLQESLMDLLTFLYGNYKTEGASLTASSNGTSIAAGAYALIFLLVFFFFLASLFIGSPDWSLLVLSLMAGLALFAYLSIGLGYFFLPERVLSLADNRWIIPAILGLAALYLLLLFLKRRAGFWKRLGIVLLASAGSMALVLLCVSAVKPAMARHFVEDLLMNLRGELPPSLWMVPYLTVLCGALTVYDDLRFLASQRSEARAMTVRQNLLQDNYHTIEQRFAETSMLRHDWKNQLTALNLLYQEGETEKLGQRLRELDAAVDSLRLPVFSQCFIVNALLQNASVRAEREGIEFRASAPLPTTLDMDEGDLCSFLINMLDNALEAAAKTLEGQRRFIDLNVHTSQGFLAVCCRNSCAGPVEMLDGALPETTRSRKEGHGLGLRQMEQIAKRYHSKLDLSCDDGVFMVQTAFMLKSNKKTAPETEAV